MGRPARALGLGADLADPRPVRAHDLTGAQPVGAGADVRGLHRLRQAYVLALVLDRAGAAVDSELGLFRPRPVGAAEPAVEVMMSIMTGLLVFFAVAAVASLFYDRR